MKLYWTSLLIQDTENSKPWLCSMTGGYTSLEEAMKTIQESKNNYRILCAWIDTFDENGNKSTVFHECYVNAIGHIG